MQSDYPCELCGENLGTNVWYHAHAKNLVITLCSLCRAETEEKDGLTHHFVAHHCPTCNHRTYLRFVKYNENDIEAKKCRECGRWMHRKNASMREKKIEVCSNGRSKTIDTYWICEDCSAKNIGPRKESTKGIPEVTHCEKCGRKMKAYIRTKPTGKVVLYHACWYCDIETEEKLLKKMDVKRPDNVKELKTE